MAMTCLGKWKTNEQDSSGHCVFWCVCDVCECLHILIYMSDLYLPSVYAPGKGILCNSCLRHLYSEKIRVEPVLFYMKTEWLLQMLLLYATWPRVVQSSKCMHLAIIINLVVNVQPNLECWKKFSQNLPK